MKTLYNLFLILSICNYIIATGYCKSLGELSVNNIYLQYDIAEQDFMTLIKEDIKRTKPSELSVRTAICDAFYMTGTTIVTSYVMDDPVIKGLTDDLMKRAYTGAALTTISECIHGGINDFVSNNIIFVYRFHTKENKIQKETRITPNMYKAAYDDKKNNPQNYSGVNPYSSYKALFENGGPKKPIQIDEYTRFCRVKVIGKDVYYDYEISDELKEILDADLLKEMKADLKAGYREQMKTASLQTK